MFIGSPRNLSSKIGDKPVLINNAPVPRTETFTCLGVKLDGKLNWENEENKTLCSQKNFTRYI